MNTNLYQHRDNLVEIQVLEKDKKTPINSFEWQNVQYRVTEQSTGIHKIAKSLGAGIIPTTEGKFLIHLPREEVTMTGIKGEYTHSLTLGKTTDELLPSAVDSAVPIIAGWVI